jgi:DNA-binding beta-propeller fold protein YncE
VDPQGPFYYGITTHEVGRIDSVTGRFEAFKSPASGAKPSWPSAVAFDSKQGRLLIAARSTGYSFYPQTGVWQELPWLKDDGIVALAYDPGQELLYALQRDGGSQVAANLIQFNAKGARINRTVLSSPIPVGDYPAPLAQLVPAGDSLIGIVHASPENSNVSVTTGGRLFVIDPRSGECRPVRPSSNLQPNIQ